MKPRSLVKEKIKNSGESLNRWRSVGERLLLGVEWMNRFISKVLERTF